MKGPPPLRFLAVVIGGWIGMRAAMLAPDWSPRAISVKVASVAATADAAGPINEPLAVFAHTSMRPNPVADSANSGRPDRAPPLRTRASVPQTERAASAPPPELAWAGRTARRATEPSSAETGPLGPTALPAAPIGERRFAGSAWIFVRQGSGAQLVPGGMLGGSQIGGRITYRLNHEPGRPLSLSARFYSPLNERRAAEAALGVEWKPVSALPIRLLAERRQAVGSRGRSAFSLLGYGGVSEVPVGPARLDAYAQAGMVGLKRRDLFADGSVQLGVPMGAFKLGGGLWGAAQPGVERLDIGPQISVRLPVPGANLRLSADWRMRVAGDAAPASGPSITLATDF